jgi:hypothetical protein
VTVAEPVTEPPYGPPFVVVLNEPPYCWSGRPTSPGWTVCVAVQVVVALGDSGRPVQFRAETDTFPCTE